MKRFYTLLVILTLFSSGIHSATASDEADWMPDANLRTAVRSALSLGNNDTLTQAGMANLTGLTARNAQISSLTGLEHATNLQKLDLRDNTISNISALSGLTDLESLKLKGNNISSVTGLSGLTSLTLLNLKDNNISSISGLSGLTNLEHLRVDGNSITDVQPLTGLTSLKKLWIARNSLTNAHLLSSLTGLTHIDITIPDPPDTTAPTVTIDVPSGTQTGAFNVTITFSETVSGFTRLDVSLSGSAASITSWSANSDDTVYTATITPTASGTVTIGVAANVATDAANNQNTAATSQNVTVSVDTTAPSVSISVNSYNTSGYGASISPVVDAIPLVTVTFTEPVRRDEFDPRSALTFSGPTMTINIAAPMSDRCSEVTVGEETIRLCEQWLYDLTAAASGELTFNIAAGVAMDLAGNSNTAATALTVTVDIDRPEVSRVIVPSGPQIGEFDMKIEFTEPVSPGGTSGLWGSLIISSSDLTISSPAGVSYRATFKDEKVDRTTYILTLTPNGERWSTDGKIRIAAISSDTVKDAARNLNLQQSLSESVSPYVSIFSYSPYDVDKDDDVDIMDIKFVVGALDQSGDNIENSRTDVNGDDTVDIDDLLAVIDNFGNVSGAPSNTVPFTQFSQKILETLDPTILKPALNNLRLKSDGSLKYQQAIVFLEYLLEAMRPDETVLLANYPNPFNPETWLPYHLANGSHVRISIYDINGGLVRQLDLGHQRAGYYTGRSRAAYWDGRNEFGERVATGIYFYQLQADNVSLLRKMVILK